MDLDKIKAKVQESIRRHACTLGKVVGVSILAGLSACSILPFIPAETLGISETLEGLIAGLGANTLATWIYENASSLARGPSETETEHFTRLAHILEKQIQQNEAFRKDINRLLQQTDAVDVAIKTLQPMNKFNEFNKVIEELKNVQLDLRDNSEIYIDTIDTPLPLSDGKVKVIPSASWSKGSNSNRLRGF